MVAPSSPRPLSTKSRTLGPVADPVQEAPETAQIIALEAVLAQKDAARAAEEKPSMRRDLFDLDAAPEQGSTPPAPIIALTPPAPQPPEIPGESTQSTARGQMAARLRQAQRAKGVDHYGQLLRLFLADGSLSTAWAWSAASSFSNACRRCPWRKFRRYCASSR